MDRQSTYTLSLFGESNPEGDSSNKQLQKELVAFVLDFHLDNVFIYRYGQEETHRQDNADSVAETRSERMCCQNSTTATSTLPI
jgi:DNA replication licensing factor MCM5